jgi:glucose-1-phosphate adenylyltransferase
VVQRHSETDCPACSRYLKTRRAVIDKDVDIPEGREIGYNLAEDRKRFTVTDSGIVVISKGEIV